MNKKLYLTLGLVGSGLIGFFLWWLFRKKRKRKKIAIIDVNDTLLLNGNRWNDDLLKSLKDNDINTVYLLTNMDATSMLKEKDDKQTFTITKLLNKMEQQGFDVKDVITPADRFYDDDPGQFFKDYTKDVTTWKKYQELYSKEKETNKKEMFSYLVNNKLSKIKFDVAYIMDADTNDEILPAIIFNVNTTFDKVGIKTPTNDNHKEYYDKKIKYAEEQRRSMYL